MRRRDFLLGCSAAAVAVSGLSSKLLADMTQMAPGDPRADSAYANRRIKHISDEDLFAALDLARPGLTGVRAAAERKDFPAAHAAWGKYWEDVAPKRAKFTGDGEFLCSREDVAAWLANSKATVLAAAERLMRHDIAGWGPKPIQHGPVVDFNADYGKSGKYGFHYWVWARPLVQAFILTGDNNYLAEFDQLFNQWYEQRDAVHGEWPGLDVIYYELGVGVRNRLFLEAYCLPLPTRTAQTHERMLKTLLGAARWLFEEEKLGYREHNWQIIGSYGLAHIGLMVPEFSESPRWVKLGAQRMSEHVAHDFFADGCFSERCPSSYMLIGYRDPRNLARLLADDPSQRATADQLRGPLERSLNFWLGVLPPDGVLPPINDGARSRMLPAILQDGPDLFGRRDLAWAKKHVLGAESKDDGTEPAFRSVHFPASGFTVMRSDWTKDARYLLINHGPYGGGHSHADALSFELHGFGRPLAVDSGIGDTYDDPLQTAWYVHSRAHNMLTFDGADCDRVAGVGTDVAWTSTDRFDHFAATHRGYEASKGIVHRRHIVFVKPDYFVVYDVIGSKPGAKECGVEWNLHLTVSPDAHEGPGLVVEPSEPWAREMSKGSASVLDIAGFEGKNQAEIDWLMFRSRLNPGETKTLGVLLVPFAHERPAVKIERAATAATTPGAAAGRDATFIVSVGGRTDRISFAEGGVEITSEKA